MARGLYTVAIHALLPWALVHLLTRARKQPEYLQHCAERFGRYPSRQSVPTLWIHAVSVGETRAAQPLVAALRHAYPDHRILLTHMTPTGRQTAADLFGDTVESVYLPYDTPWAMKAFLRHFRPALGLIMETELWPNLIAACRQSGIPLLLANARLSEKSALRYARFPRLTRAALESLSAISAITATDAERLGALGAPNVSINGSVKFDIDPPAAQLAVGAHFRQNLGNRAVFLCASTREGEETLILDAWQKVGADGTALTGLNPLLVLVPRHPQRFDDVARLIGTRGLALQRRSDGQAVAAGTQVWLGDSMGELFAYYEAARSNGVAFVGGSLLDHGSQNLIEPCAVGTPVLIGPSTFNFAEAARLAIAAGAAHPVRDAEDLVRHAAGLLADAAARQAMGEAGRGFAAQHRGATARTLELVRRFIPAGR